MTRSPYWSTSGPRRSAGPASSGPHRRRMWSTCAAAWSRSTPSPGSAPRNCGICCSSNKFTRALGALTGNQAVQMVRGGTGVDLPLRLAGRRRRQPVRPDLPGPEPLPGQLGAGRRAPDQQRAAARRPDRSLHREERHRLPGADCRRRRGRLRWSAERLRADEVDDRRPERPACTGRTSWRRRRSADISAARC